ncbi:MAG: general secretion pathway protein C [Betaproteobacteria bacterium HGW-Betaproteobacteria-9]|jgi:general secretion pathway protein C|nr:MAG: general secretion pathway protein C [Betaproteobacteria bacterium HGW-Betaproteobacteria-9]
MNKRAFSGRVFNPVASAAAGWTGGRFWPALAAGLFWLAAGLSAGYWALRVWGQGPLTPLAALAVSAPQVDVAAVARALGSRPSQEVAEGAPPPPTTRYRLIGLAVRPGQDGAALIAIDDQPPRPVRVGDVLEAGLVLQSVNGREARLGPQRIGPSTVQLVLPKVED